MIMMSGSVEKYVDKQRATRKRREKKKEREQTGGALLSYLRTSERQERN